MRGRLGERLARMRRALAQFLYGLTGYDFARHAVAMRHEMEAVFMIVTFGDLIDADRRIHEYQDEIRKKILDMYGFDKVPEEIDNYIAAASAEPAMEESAIFDAVVDIIVQGSGSTRC